VYISRLPEKNSLCFAVSRKSSYEQK